MRHKDRLSDEEAKARRLESARKYREANREKTREAARLSQAKRRQDPAVKEREKVYKQDSGYLERQRQYRAENKAQLTASAMAWREENPEKYAEYQKAYQLANRQRTIKRLQNWRINNRVHASEYGKAWRKENPGEHARHEHNRRARMKEAGGELTAGLYGRLMVVQRGKCAACRVSIKGIRAHMDHQMPLALGGSNTDDNMQLLCPPCNQSKHAKHPVDFMQERGFLL